MRRLGLGVRVVALAAVAAAACATAEDPTGGAPMPPEEDGGIALPDAEAPGPTTDGGELADVMTPKEIERCSSDDWCLTDLPDIDLNLRDIRPFEARAFAVAESGTFGVQFLEWEQTTDAWKYIGDGSQNQLDRGEYAGDMWAASENEVYFTLAPAFVYHGIRPDPASTFTWKISRLDGSDAPAHDPGRVWAANVAHIPPGMYTPPGTRPPYDYFAPSLGVDGMPWGEVYAWYGPTLFRRTVASSGEDQWVVEHTLADVETPEDEFHIQGVAGGAPDDFWIAGVRSRVAHDGVRERACPLAVQRRADGYHHFLDHVVNPTRDPKDLLLNVCDPKPGAMRLMGRFEIPGTELVMEFETGNAGWIRGLRHVGPNTVLGLHGANSLVYLKSDGDTPLARSNDIEHAPAPINNLYLRYNALWIGDGSAWVAGNGLMLSVDHDLSAWSRGVGIWASPSQAADMMQASTFTLSSLARGGAPLIAPLHQVRGISNSNLWAIGERHAFHRTTP